MSDGTKINVRLRSFDSAVKSIIDSRSRMSVLGQQSALALLLTLNADLAFDAAEQLALVSANAKSAIDLNATLVEQIACLRREAENLRARELTLAQDHAECEGLRVCWFLELVERGHSDEQAATHIDKALNERRTRLGVRIGVDLSTEPWERGLRLRSGSGTTLSDEMTLFDQQFPDAKGSSEKQ